MGEVFEDIPGCLKVSITNWPPLVDISEVPFKGFSTAVFRTLMDALGLCYWLIKTPDQKWGDKLQNGTWNGMVGEVAVKNVNMAMGPMGVNWLRTEIVEYVFPHMNGENVFLYKRVTKAKPDMFIFLKTFNSQVWTYTALVILLISSASIFFHSAYNSSRKSKSVGSDSNSTENVVRKNKPLLQFLWGIRIFLLQDSISAPRGDAGRFISVTWMLGTLILTVMYRCNLKAILMTTKVVPPIDSMEDIVNQDEYKWIIVAGTYYGGYFENEHIVAPNTIRGRMHPKRAPIDIQNAADIGKTVIGNKYAAVAPNVALDGAIARDFSKVGDCRLTYTKSGFHNLFLSFAIEKKHPLKNKMDLTMLRLIEAGIPDHIRALANRNASWCTRSPKKSDITRPFGVPDFYGIFIIYCIGTTVGVFILVGEIVKKKYHNKLNELKRKFLELF